MEMFLPCTLKDDDDDDEDMYVRNYIGEIM
jgi:hypothetical protein